MDICHFGALASQAKPDGEYFGEGDRGKRLSIRDAWLVLPADS